MSCYRGNKISASQIREFCNGDGEQKKNNKLRLAKKRTLHVHHAFLYNSQPLLHDCDMKLPNFKRPLYGVGEHNTKILILDKVLSDLTQKMSPTFDKLNKIK